jgi:hypothetical protein
MMKKKNKLNPELLKEELKKFRLLSEYSFYMGEDEKVYGSELDKPIILGDESYVSEADEDLETDIPVDDTDVPTEDPQAPPVDDTEVPPVDDTEMPPVDDAEMPPVEDSEIPPVEEPAPAGDEVEIDVTSIVKGTEEAKAAAEAANSNAETLLKKLDDLESRISNMDALGNKISELELEFKKRNPTPVERQQLISLKGFPFNIPISEYWEDKDEQDEKEKEYVLTQKDVDEFSDEDIKNSFNDYDEEDIK